jgi:hypothetical protein
VVINPYLRPPRRDTFPNSVEVADALSLAWQSRVMDWITSEESSLPDKQLVAQNYCNFYSSAREFLPGVSIINFHYAYPEAPRSNYGPLSLMTKLDSWAMRMLPTCARPGISCSQAAASSQSSPR